MYKLVKLKQPAVGSVIKGNTIEVEVSAYQFGLQSVTGNGTIYL